MDFAVDKIVQFASLMFYGSIKQFFSPSFSEIQCLRKGKTRPTPRAPTVLIVKAIAVF
jgi:hypothetical protein